LSSEVATCGEGTGFCVRVEGLKEARVPVLVHAPHAGTAIPAAVRRDLALSDSALAAEVAHMTDWHTDALFSSVLDLGGVLFVNRLSRLVVDPERFEDDAKEPMAAVGMGAVYTRTADGTPLRPGVSPREREELLQFYFRPYAVAFETVVASLLRRFGGCLIVDAHSFPSRPLPYEADQDPKRPEICLGTDPFHTPEPLARAIERECVKLGLTVERDRPFAGTYVPLRYLRRDPRVVSIMAEVRRDLYCSDSTGLIHPGWERARGLVSALLQAAAMAYSQAGDRPGTLAKLPHKGSP